MNAATLFMAFVMLCEAGQGGVQAMRPVGHVIVNRQRAAGQPVRAVLRRPAAFECVTRDWHARMLRIARGDEGQPQWKRWQEAKALAVRIRTGRDRDPTKGATHFHSGRRPAWARELKRIARIGGNTFYRAPA